MGRSLLPLPALVLAAGAFLPPSLAAAPPALAPDPPTVALAFPGDGTVVASGLAPGAEVLWLGIALEPHGALSEAGSSSQSHMTNTPLLSIALDCQKHAGREVTVTGAIAIAFELQAVCPTREFLDADPLHCLWLVADHRLSGEAIDALSEKVKRGQYVTIDGAVTCDPERHGPLYGGGLEKVSIVISHSDGAVIWP